MSTATLTAPIKNPETGKWEVEDGDGNVYEFESRKAAREWEGPGSDEEPAEESDEDDAPAEVIVETSIESRLISMVNSVSRLLNSKIRNIMPDLGKNETEILNHLEDDGMPQGELASRMNTASTNVGQAIHKLEDAGLVVSMRSKTDRRSFDIFLTDEGKKVKAEVVQKREEAISGLFDNFKDGELESLEELLQKFA